VLAAALAGCRQHPPIAPEVIYRTAQLEFRQGDLAGAFKTSEDFLHQARDADSEWAWRFRVLKAEIFIWRGMSKDALALLDANPPASLQGTDIAARRELVQGLALCYLQRFLESEQHLAAAQNLAETTQPDLLGEILLGHGTLAVLQNEYPTAQGFFRRSLQFARDKNQPFLEGNSMGSLGLVAMREEHFDESIDWYQQSLALSRSLGARTSIAKTLGNMGWSYYRMGDYEAALALSIEADGAAEKLGLLRDRQIWLTNIGNVHFTQGDSSGAKGYYERALTIARSLDNKAAITQCLNNLSFVELERGEFEQARQYNKEAAELEGAGADPTGSLYSVVVAGRIEAANENLGGAQKLFTQVAEDPAADTSLRWEAQSRLARVFRDEGQIRAAEHEYQQSIETIESARRSLSRDEFRLSFLSSAIEFYDDYIEFLISQGRPLDAQEVAEISRARALAEGLGFNSGALIFPLKDFEPVRVSRKLNSIVLSYWLGAQHSYMWAVTPSRVVMYTLPPAREIDALVHSYRKVLVGPRDVVETDSAEGKRLFEILIAPAKGLIPNGSRVTILPDGSLYGLNFEALLVPAPELHYWIEDVTVTNANSLLLLAASAAGSPAASKNLLLVGDPVSPNAEFPDLPQASIEMSRIEKYFSPSKQTVLTRTQATPAAYFESKPANFSYIHFVAHGTASRTSPLDSAVVLTKSGDSYKLYARDIIKQRLRANLVTISACHGAGERTYSGEGLVGLTWAFLRAGAHGVIAALWEVNDNSTPQLMDQLYSEISEGKSPDAALRDAKLALIHSGTVYRKPFYWAPFQIYRGS
jgi:CHAT domain-containing protein